VDDDREEPEKDDPWVVLVVSLKGHDVPTAVRVKRWLKSGLRGYGLKCIEIRTARPDEIEQAGRTMEQRNE